jgi:hypothetical protein
MGQIWGGDTCTQGRVWPAAQWCAAYGHAGPHLAGPFRDMLAAHAKNRGAVFMALGR